MRGHAPDDTSPATERWRDTRPSPAERAKAPLPPATTGAASEGA
ncbi:hypothetical protein ABZT47_18410 [Sphaerisporangium sp. NPDC005289]|uniref:Uncharacterized protein n=1 Tax=Sphaerisporangium rhizosphaerae TaxID=2269375 RepID=A0ABW2P545_9ACTN